MSYFIKRLNLKNKILRTKQKRNKRTEKHIKMNPRDKLNREAILLKSLHDPLG